MLGLKNIITKNLLLKMTSLNAVVIFIRLVISFFVQRLLSTTFGESGIAKIGQIRNLLQILTSTSSLGVFNGVVKYVSEHEQNKVELSKLFSTTFIFSAIGSVVSALILFFNADSIAVILFEDQSFNTVIKYLAFLPPVIAFNRICYGLISGLSDYKKHAKIELLTYILSVSLLLVGLYLFNLKGVLFAIVLSPLLNFGVLVLVFYKKIKTYIHIKTKHHDLSYVKPLMAFTLMSFVSTVLINYIELDLRTVITNRINIDEAGYWTAINFISKNYMVFSSSIFTLYVIPKFAKIETGNAFAKEVIHIYKTLLPLFGVGMILVYLSRHIIVDLIYPNFEGVDILFKWQLLGDFIKLATFVLGIQFLAKKMVWTFVITELMSLSLFYFLSLYFVDEYGAEGVVMAHFYRYLVYFFIVIVAVWLYFVKQKKQSDNA